MTDELEWKPPDLLEPESINRTAGQLVERKD